MRRSGLPSFVLFCFFCPKPQSCPVSYHYTTWLIRPITLWHAHVFLLSSLLPNKTTKPSADCLPQTHALCLMAACYRSNTVPLLSFPLTSSPSPGLSCASHPSSPPHSIAGSGGCRFLCQGHVAALIVSCLLHLLLTYCVQCFGGEVVGLEKHRWWSLVDLVSGLLSCSPGFTVVKLQKIMLVVQDQFGVLCL